MRKPLSRHVQVGDIISFSFNDIPGSQAPEPWIGTVVERKYHEWLDSTTGRWREGLSLGVMWDIESSYVEGRGVFWVKPKEWEDGRYALVATSASRRAKR